MDDCSKHLLSNDLLFEMVMKDEDISKLTIENLLGRKISKIKYCQTQKTIKNTVEPKGVRLDVYFEGDTEIYNVEMQVGGKDLEKRARYYQSVIDNEVLKTGKDYNELKDVYIIFICTEDIFKQGYYMYEIEQKVNDIEYVDGTHKIYFNCSYTKSIPKEQEHIKEFLDYLVKGVGIGNDGDIKTEFVKKMSDKVDAVKNGKEYKEMYYNCFEGLAQEYEAKGIAIGEARGEAIGEARGEAIGEARGKAIGTIKVAREFGLSIDEIVQKYKFERDLVERVIRETTQD